MLALNVPKTTT